MTKIAHLADIHIRNFRFHERYKYSFNDLYSKLKKEEVDYICVAGDIAHTKENLSAEFFELATDFFKNLSKIAPTIITIGNHDINLSNSRRQDAITPIIEALNDDNIFYLKNSKVLNIDEQISFCHLSIVDYDWDDKVYSNIDSNKINIGIFHGPVSGCSTDAGFSLDSKVGTDSFEKFDFTFLGDIHKYQYLDEAKRIAYPGSLIQQDYGESTNKGFLVWNIVSKEEGYSKFVKVDDMCPFVTFTIKDKKVKNNFLSEDDIPKNSFARFIIEDDITENEIQELITPIITKYTPRDRRIINKGNKTSLTSDELTENKYNYRDLAYQKKILNIFCNKKNVSETVRQKVLEVHTEVYNQTLDKIQNNDLVRNVQFDLARIDFSNMFSYGRDNYVEFSLLNGVIGIFGANATGKSSVIDSFLLGLFNNISKRLPSAADAVNNRESDGEIKVSIKNGNTNYLIERDFSWKESSAQNSSERGKSKTNVKIYENDEDISSTQRQKTDQVIQSIFGHMEDYVTTSIAPQEQMNKFIHLTDSPRKDYLIRILDLDFFDIQLDYLKEIAAPIKAKLNKKESENDLLILIENLNKEIDNNNSLISKTKDSIVNLELLLKEEIQSLSNEENQLKNIDLEDYVNINELKNIVSLNKDKVVSYENEIIENKNKIELLTNNISDARARIEEYESFIVSYDIQGKNDKIDDLSFILSRKSSIEDEIKKLQRDLISEDKNSKVLNEVPCGDQFPNCKFISNAFISRDNVKNLKLKISENEQLMANLLKENNFTSFEDISNLISSIQKDNIEYREKCEQKNKINNLIDKAQTEIDKNSLKNETLLSKIEFSKELIKNNEDKILNTKSKEDILKEKIRIENNIKLIKNKIEITENDIQAQRREIDSLNLETGKLKSKIELNQEKIKDIKKARNDYEAYEVLLESYSRNGLVQQILEDLEPSINNEIDDILKDVTPFKVEFDLKDPKFRIYLKGNNSKRPIELASGFEKMISSLAIRVALLKLSSLPKLSTLIIDEGFGAYDYDNRMVVDKLFEALKSRFKNIIIITHIDSIKDMVDHVININVDNDGYSYVRYSNI